jgi:glycosyltransferase involved in cell wall biosynthesis
VADLSTNVTHSELETPDELDQVKARPGSSPFPGSHEAVCDRGARSPGLLRVLVLFHEDEVLGAGMSVLRALQELGAYGWSVSGWFPGSGPLLETASPLLASVHYAERPLAVSFRGWREHPGTISRLRRTPAYLRALESALLEIRPHVVHTNTLLALPEAAVARRWGLPVVLQSHELPLPSIKREATILAGARVADVLVGVSDAVSSMLRRYAFGTPVLTVHNGVPAGPASAPPAEPFTVGSIGSVSHVKGTDVFLRAAQLAIATDPDIRFSHVGPTGPLQDKRFHDSISQLTRTGERGAIAMLGQVPAADVLPTWSVYVSASRSEGFPLATLEAMAAGVPVIATAVGGVPEQIEHMVTGILVPSGDADAIASWIIRLRNEPDLRTRLGTEARCRVGAEFTLARQAQGLHHSYLSALNLRFGPPAVRSDALRAR